MPRSRCRIVWASLICEPALLGVALLSPLIGLLPSKCLVVVKIISLVLVLVGTISLIIEYRRLNDENRRPEQGLINLRSILENLAVRMNRSQLLILGFSLLFMLTLFDIVLVSHTMNVTRYVLCIVINILSALGIVAAKNIFITEIRWLNDENYGRLQQDLI